MMMRNENEQWNVLCKKVEEGKGVKKDGCPEKIERSRVDIHMLCINSGGKPD